MTYSIRFAGVVLGLALSLPGCVQYANAPKGASYGADFAEVTVRLGVSDTVGFGRATVQEYRVSQTASYEEGQTVKIFTWAAKQPKTHLLAVGQKVYIFARMTDLGTSRDVLCTAGSSFVPKASGLYSATMSRMGEACRIDIIEQETGRTPDDLERVMYPAPQAE